MMFAINVLGAIAWLTMTTYSVILLAKMLFVRKLSRVDNDEINYADCSNMTLVAIKNENIAIDAIWDFYYAGYCDANVQDRYKLQTLYNEFVAATEMRPDMGRAVHRDILNYRIDNEEWRKELLSDLVNYLKLRHEKNNNKIQALES